MSVTRRLFTQPLSLALVVALFAGAGAQAAEWDMPDTHPTDVAPVQFSQVSAGSSHTLGLSTAGTVWAWGSNSRKQLGIERSGNAEYPVRVLGGLAGKRVRAVVAAGDHSLALTEDGEVYTWGNTTLGPWFGYDPEIPLIPTRVEGALRNRKVVAVGGRDYANYAVTEDGELFEWLRDTVDGNGIGLAEPVSILPGRRIVQVVGGVDRAFAIEDNGALWVWGDGVGPNGELGNFAGTAQPVQVRALQGKVVTTVAAGAVHALAATADGEVFAWGSNYWGQLGTGASGDSAPVSAQPVALDPALFMGMKVVKLSADRNASYALTEYGQLFAWGWNYNKQLPLPIAQSGEGVARPTQVRNAAFLDGIVDVDGGYGHGVALARDGSVVAWGSNSSGQLGVGVSPDPSQRFDPTRAEPVTAPLSLLLANPPADVTFTYPTRRGDIVKRLPTFYGTGAPGTAVSVLVSGSSGAATGNTLCTATTNSSGYWSCVSSTTLEPDATYTVRAFAFVGGRPVQPNDVSIYTANY